MNGSEPWAPNPGFQIRFYPDTANSTISALYDVSTMGGVPATKVDGNFDGWHRVEIAVTQ